MDAIAAYLRQLNFGSMLFRIFLSMLAGGFVGMERARKGRAAGFRTYMFVALGACLTMLLSEYYYALLEGPWSAAAEELGVKTDVARFGAQVINGVGFLGAGTVIVTGRQEVKGLTTAAGLWASACIGLATGAGFYEGVFISVVLLTFCIQALPRMEAWILSHSRNMNIYVEMDSIDSLSAVSALLRSIHVTILDVDIDKEKKEYMSQANVHFSLQMTEHHRHEEILALISTVDGIISVNET